MILSHALFACDTQVNLVAGIIRPCTDSFFVGIWMEMEEMDVVENKLVDQEDSNQTIGEKKKRKIQPYHHIKAHANPFSDANFEV